MNTDFTIIDYFENAEEIEFSRSMSFPEEDDDEMTIKYRHLIIGAQCSACARATKEARSRRRKAQGGKR